MGSPDVVANLGRNGFRLYQELDAHLSTIEVAETLGTVVRLEEVLPFSGIQTVQSLKPKDVLEARPNLYSGHYGLGTFPLHSDLAHWAIPPRFLLLRCIIGSDDVFSQVLSWTPIVNSVGTAVLRKAVFTGRKQRIGSSGLVRALSNHNQAEVLRWDPIFLRPVNKNARMLTSIMLNTSWTGAVVKILLRKPGDTLLIDNWRMLHGRSPVLPGDLTRHIERVYLSEVSV